MEKTKHFSVEVWYCYDWK